MKFVLYYIYILYQIRKNTNTHLLELKPETFRWRHENFMGCATL